MLKYPMIALLIGLVLFGIAKAYQYISTTQTQVCGGIAGETGNNKCPTFFHCKYPQNGYADQSGICSLF